MANFSWLISQLDSIPSLDGMDKVISVIHWRAQKEYKKMLSESGTYFETYLFDTYGALSVDAPHEASFTPYDEVTKEMVESWLEASLDIEAIEKNLNSQIENFINPPLIAYNLPWESKI